MQARIDEVQKDFYAALASVKDEKSAEDVRIAFLARSGRVAALFDALKDVPKEQKPQTGKLLNELRTEVQAAFDARKADLAAGPGGKPAPDLTLPGRHRPLGTRHPITQTLDEMKAIFGRMGFTIALGPEAEDDYHNFTALNFPPDHPAREMQDTFFISKNTLLRTHTSPVQIRVMHRQKPPIRVLMPGRVFRNEAITARSHAMFHQLEGLSIDKHVTFSELKGTLVHFAREFYGSSVKYMFRPTFFPFTEPSADMYISCIICGGKGCRMCKHVGWLEILGSGMVHPNVLRAGGLDPDEVSGYAFGMGIERIAILRYGIDDIRLFFDNDLRFLRQF